MTDPLNEFVPGRVSYRRMQLADAHLLAALQPSARAGLLVAAAQSCRSCASGARRRHRSCLEELRARLCSADPALCAAVRREECLSHSCHTRVGAAELWRHVCTTATYGLPRARQEAGRPAATPAMITVPNPAFSRRLTWQISHAALTAATGARRRCCGLCRRALRAARRYPAAWQVTPALWLAGRRSRAFGASMAWHGSFICKNKQKALYV